MEHLDPHPLEKNWGIHTHSVEVAFILLFCCWATQSELHNPVRKTIKNQRWGYAKERLKEWQERRILCPLVLPGVGDWLGTLSNTDHTEGLASTGMGCLYPVTLQRAWACIYYHGNCLPSTGAKMRLCGCPTVIGFSTDITNKLMSHWKEGLILGHRHFWWNETDWRLGKSTPRVSEGRDSSSKTSELVTKIR